MIKLIIFDLDGVLVEAKLIHYHALNKALEHYGYTIGWEEHLAKYDGLPTRKKLEKLTLEKGLSENIYNDIWLLKQKETINVIKNLIKPQDYIEQQELLDYLIGRGYKIYVASNSITESIRCMLWRSDLIQYVHRYYSNEDVRNPKPHSEIYTKCILDAGVNPKETLIVEDSHIGRKGAHESGAHVMGVLGVNEVNMSNVQKAIDKANQYKMFRPKWQGGKMNVLIPMAGAGSRFEKAGYTFPKPLIDVHGKPMIQVVVENLNIDARHIFICRKEHYEKYNLQHVLSLIIPNCEMILVDHLTEGAVNTTLLAKKYINNNDPLLIANSDQFVEWDSNEFLYACNNDSIDGSILTFDNISPKWSYAKLDNNGYVTEVKEKAPISNIATCIHYNSSVLLENGKVELIGKIVNKKQNIKVMSYNEEKNIFEPKEIINWIKKPQTNNWFELSYSDANNTCCQKRQVIFITGDHKVLTTRGWIEVQKLDENDLVATKYRYPNKNQKHFIDGTLLGDGFYRKPNKNGELGRLVLKHGKVQTEWFKHKLNILKDFPVFRYYEDGGEKLILNKMCNSSGSLIGSFGASPVWNKERERWYCSGKKEVPKDIILHPITLATWYMDDGSLGSSHDRIILCTNSFSVESLNILKNKLLELNIQISLWKRHKGYVIVISNGSQNNPHFSCFNFLSLISPYIIPSMSYKLPPAFRDNFSIENWNLGQSTLYFSKVKVKKAKYSNILSKHPHEYCIEVKDNHNFISGNMIISNCGIYYYRKGSDYVKYAEQMIRKNIRVNNEFYVCPVYNEAIADGKKIKTFHIDTMFGLGVPEDLNYFIQTYPRDKI